MLAASVVLDELLFSPSNLVVMCTQITGVFLTYLVWDAVLLENTTQLFASMLLALAISAARIVANSVGKETQNFKGQAVGWFILIMHAITIVSCTPGLCLLSFL